MMGNSQLRGLGGAEMETTSCVMEATGGSGVKTSVDGEDFKAFDFLCPCFFHSTQEFSW